MISTKQQSPSDQFIRYRDKVITGEQDKIPGGSNLPENITWKIVSRASKNAIDQIFQEYEKVLSNSNLDYTKPVGTSFRIYPPQNSCIYLMGIRKIIVSMNLIRNDGILDRLRDKNYIIEISLNDSNEKYLISDILGYTRKNCFREFEEENFHDNVKKSMDEVYRLLTFQIFSNKFPNGG